MKRKIVAIAMGVIMFSPGVYGQSEAQQIKAKVVNAKNAAATKSNTALKKEKTATSDALKTTCSNGDLQRHVELEYVDPTTKVPCKVHYRKTSEDPGHHQVLWSANSDAAYCQSKAQNFISKLEGLGWSCKSAL